MQRFQQSQFEPQHPCRRVQILVVWSIAKRDAVACETPYPPLLSELLLATKRHKNHKTYVRDFIASDNYKGTADIFAQVGLEGGRSAVPIQHPSQ